MDEEIRILKVTILRIFIIINIVVDKHIFGVDNFDILLETATYNIATHSSFGTLNKNTQIKEDGNGNFVDCVNKFSVVEELALTISSCTSK